jgi:hypothetical protein
MNPPRNKRWGIRMRLLVLLLMGLWTCVHIAAAAPFEEPRLPGVAPSAVVLGEDRDGDGDPDEVQINLEVAEIQEEVYPGKRVTFWVFGCRVQPSASRRATWLR